MVNSYSKSLKGKVVKWMSYSDLSNFCQRIKQEISCKIILINTKTNCIANPKSLLNTLNLHVMTGDELEIALISSSENELIFCYEKAKEIFGEFIKYEKILKI